MPVVADFFQGFGVAREVVNVVGVNAAEDALHHGTVSRATGRPVPDVDVHQLGEAAEVFASKVSPVVDDDELWQPPMTSDDIAQQHHVRPVRGRVERQVDAQNPPSERVNRQRQPRAAENLSGSLGNKLDVDLRVIHVHVLEGTRTVDRRVGVQNIHEFISDRATRFHVARGLPAVVTDLDAVNQGRVRRGLMLSCYRAP